MVETVFSQGMGVEADSFIDLGSRSMGWLDWSITGMNRNEEELTTRACSIGFIRKHHSKVTMVTTTTWGRDTAGIAVQFTLEK